MRSNRWARSRDCIASGENTNQQTEISQGDTCQPSQISQDVLSSEETHAQEDTSSDTSSCCSEVDASPGPSSRPQRQGQRTSHSVAKKTRSVQASAKTIARQQKTVEKLGLTPGLKLFTCGCGELGAEQLCDLLFQFGIRSVLDVRALPKSKKKPWFNSDSLAKCMRSFGLTYHFVGKGRKSHTVVAALVQKCEQPTCLLGFRGSPLECARLVLSQKMSVGLGWHLIHMQPCCDVTPPERLMAQPHRDVFGRYSAAMTEIVAVQSKLDCKFAFTGHWRERVLMRYGSIHYEAWDHVFSAVDPTVVELPWGSVLIVLPKFLSGPALRSLQQNTLPGAIAYEQPRRRTASSKASYIKQHKEAWFCNDYGYADPTLLSPPHLYKQNLLRPWADDLLQHASTAAKSAFNSLMCRWDPPGVFADDGPHSFARGSPMLEYTAVGLLGVTGSRYVRVHGLGCWEKLAVDVPIQEGTLVVFGGPLKERWLYLHVRDTEARGERVLMTLMLHADSETLDSTKHNCSKGKGDALDFVKSHSEQETSATPVNSLPPPSANSAAGACRARWRRQPQN